MLQWNVHILKIIMSMHVCVYLYDLWPMNVLTALERSNYRIFLKNAIFKLMKNATWHFELQV